MPLLASDFCADHGTVVAQDAVVCSAASSGSVLATQVQYGTGSQRDARPEASFDQHCCADLAPAKSSSLASFCSSPSQMVVVAYLQHAGFTLRNL